MTRAARRVGQITVTAVIVATAILIGYSWSLAANATTGCVYSGGGWICAGQQPPSEPGELITEEPAPVVTVVPEVVGSTDGEQTGEVAPAPAPEPVAPAPAPAPKPNPPAACVP